MFEVVTDKIIFNYSQGDDIKELWKEYSKLLHYNHYNMDSLFLISVSEKRPGINTHYKQKYLHR